MSPALDYLIIPAALQDGSDDVARFVVPRSDRIEIVETWDAMGMRSTGSHDIILHDVEVHDADMLGRTDSTTPTKGGKVNAWFMLVISAVYLGVAEAARTAAAEYAQHAGSHRAGPPDRHAGEHPAPSGPGRVPDSSGATPALPRRGPVGSPTRSGAANSARRWPRPRSRPPTTPLPPSITACAWSAAPV